ncbi:helix-turn-helix domain-containing protein [Segniliparus sp.]|uniref:helix-turn-helix domain-containing protein n=1 Tax=Segniliparus sp. TaxID=2804064 RepID=UPI003F67990F
MAELGYPAKSYPHKVAPESFLYKTVSLQTSALAAGYRKASSYRTMNNVSGAPYSTEGRIHISSLLIGNEKVESSQRQGVFSPGSIWIAMADEPYSSYYDSAHHISAIDLPIELLSLPAKDLRAFAFAPLVSEQMLVSLFLTAIRSVLNAGDLDPDGVDAYLGGTVDLVLRTTLGLDPDHADTQTARRHQIERYVREHFTDPNLGATTIAAALRISPRLVYQLFQNHAETLTEVIQRYRVEYAKYLLTTGPASLTLDQIAEQSGFGSTRTFTRAFQRTTGNTPRRHARAQQSNPGNPTSRNRRTFL